MMKKNTLIIFIYFCLILIAKSQDFHYTQFYAAPLYLNPAMTGSTELTRIGINYRKQWPGLNHDFDAFSSYFDHYSYDLKMGFGLSINSFQESNMKLNTSDVSSFFSYNLRLSNSLNFRLGSQISIFRRSAILDNLLFGDQIDIFSKSINLFTIDDIPNFEPYSYFDLSFGGLLTGQNFWIGGSTHHVNRPSLSFFPDDQIGYMNIKWSVHGAYNFPLGNTYFKGSNYDNQAIIMVNYKKQGPFQQFDFGTQLMYRNILSGIGYRGIPGVRNMPNMDSIIFLGGIIFENGLVLGYSYDYLVSNIGYQAKGAHEVSIRYQFMMGDPKKRNQRSTILKCFDYMM
jgi:type IX secretion system PorP/SprF family membrane protein